MSEQDDENESDITGVENELAEFELEELYRCAVVNWMKAVEYAEHKSKRRGLYAFLSPVRAHATIRKAFDRNRRLRRGIHLLYENYMKCKLNRHRTQVVGKRVIQHWKYYIDYFADDNFKFMESVTFMFNNIRGIHVWSLLRWIAATIGQNGSTYAFNWNLNKSLVLNIDGNDVPNDHDNMGGSGPYVERSLGVNTISTKQISRFREYIIGRVLLPQKNISYHIHAIALVDVYIYRQCFFCWKSYAAKSSRVNVMKKYIVCNHYFHRWVQYKTRSQELYLALLRVQISMNFNMQYRYFSEWWLLHKTNLHLNTTTHRKLELDAIARLHSFVAGRAVQRILHQHSMIYHRCRFLMIGLKQLLQYVFRGRSYIQKHVVSFVRETPSDNIQLMFDEAGVLSDEPVRKRRSAFDVLQMYYKHHPLPVYHGLNRSRKKVNRWWSTKRSLSAQYEKDILNRYLRIKSGFSHFARSVHFRKRLKCAGESTQLNSIKYHYSSAFKIWFRFYRYRNRTRIAANRMVCKRFHCILFNAFSAWQNQYERSILFKSNNRLLLIHRVATIKENSEQWDIKRKVTSKRSLLVCWAKMVRLRRLGRLLIDIYENSGRLYLMKLRLERWRLVLAVDAIASCFQKIWRGYHCRKMSKCSWAHSHMLKYSQLIRVVVGRITRKSLHRLGFNTLHENMLRVQESQLNYCRYNICKHIWARLLFNLTNRRQQIVLIEGGARYFHHRLIINAWNKLNSKLYYYSSILRQASAFFRSQIYRKFMHKLCKFVFSARIRRIREECYRNELCRLAIIRLSTYKRWRFQKRRKALRKAVKSKLLKGVRLWKHWLLKIRNARLISEVLNVPSFAVLEGINEIDSRKRSSSRGKAIYKELLESNLVVLRHRVFQWVSYNRSIIAMQAIASKGALGALRLRYRRVVNALRLGLECKRRERHQTSKIALKYLRMRLLCNGLAKWQHFCQRKRIYRKVLQRNNYCSSPVVSGKKSASFVHDSSNCVSSSGKSGHIPSPVFQSISIPRKISQAVLNQKEVSSCISSPNLSNVHAQHSPDCVSPVWNQETPALINPTTVSELSPMGTARDIGYTSYSYFSSEIGKTPGLDSPTVPPKSWSRPRHATSIATTIAQEPSFETKSCSTTTNFSSPRIRSPGCEVTARRKQAVRRNIVGLFLNRTAPTLKKLALTAPVELRILQRGFQSWVVRVWSINRTRLLIHQKFECIGYDTSGLGCLGDVNATSSICYDNAQVSNAQLLRRALDKLQSLTQRQISSKKKFFLVHKELNYCRMSRWFREMRVRINVRSARYRTVAIQRLLKEADAFICILSRMKWYRNRRLLLSPVGVQQYTLRVLRVSFLRIINFRSKRRAYLHLSGRIATRHYRILKLQQALQYWKKYSTLKKQLGKITRRFRLRPSLIHWTACAVISLKARRIVRSCRVKYFSRIVRNLFLLWRHYALRSSRLRVQSNVVMKKIGENIKCRVLYRWMYLVTNGRELVRVEAIRESRRFRTLNVAFKKWTKAFTIHSMFTRQSCIVVFRSWRDYSVNRRYKRECNEYGEWCSDMRLVRKGFFQMFFRRKRRNRIAQYGIDGEACVLLLKLRCGLQYWRRWAWWRRRQQLYSRKRPGFDGVLGLFSSYSTGLSSSGVSRMSKVYNHVMNSSYRPAPTTPLIPSDFSYVVLRRAINTMYKFARLNSYNRRMKIPRKCVLRWKYFAHRNHYIRDAFVARVDGILKKALLHHVLLHKWMKYHQYQHASFVCMKLVVAKRKHIVFAKWRHQFIELRNRNATLRRLMTVVDTGITRQKQKLKRLTFHYWFVSHATQHDQIIMNDMNKRHFFECWLNAFKLILIRNKYLSKAVIKAWYNYVFVTLEKRRKRVVGICKAVGILDMRIMHMYHKLIHKAFGKWKSNKIEVTSPRNFSTPRRNVSGLGRQSLMRSKDLAQWQSQVKLIRSCTTKSDDQINGTVLAQKFDEAVTMQPHENSMINSDQTPVARRNFPIPIAMSVKTNG